MKKYRSWHRRLAANLFGRHACHGADKQAWFRHERCREIGFIFLMRKTVVHLGQPEIENFEQSAVSHKNVFRLEITMDDGLLVSRSQSGSDLYAIRDGRGGMDRACLYEAAKRISFEKLRYDVRIILLYADVINYQNVRMI